MTEWLTLPADELRRHLRALGWVVTERRPRGPSGVWTATVASRAQPHQPILGRAQSRDGAEQALRAAATEALTLRAAALDPEATPGRLAALAEVLPDEVRANPALPVLRVMYPNLFERVLP